MKKLLKLFLSFLFLFLLYGCNNTTNNPISSNNNSSLGDNNDTDPHFVSSMSVVQNVPKRSYVPFSCSIPINSYAYNYNGEWTDFSTYDLQTESFDVFCSLSWDVPYMGVYAFNIFEIRDLNNNIIFSHTIVKLGSSGLTGNTDYSQLNINLNPNQNYQYRIQLYCTNDEDKSCK